MNAAERKLLHLFREMPEARRDTFLAFGEFLLNRALQDEPAPSAEPVGIPRPEKESVIKAIQRLRATYPMVEASKLLNDTSNFMTQHIIHGKPAAEVVDELEICFRRHYDNYLKDRANLG